MCQHKNIIKGVMFPENRLFSLCRDCQRKWLDNGRRADRQYFQATYRLVKEKNDVSAP